MQRDEIVFHEVKARNIPLFMVTSGGYQVSTICLSMYIICLYIREIMLK